jgi:hypothetical protein
MHCLWSMTTVSLCNLVMAPCFVICQRDLNSHTIFLLCVFFDIHPMNANWISFSDIEFHFLCLCVLVEKLL